MRLLLLLLAFQPIHAFCSHSPTFGRPEQTLSGWKQPSRSPIQKTSSPGIVINKQVPSSLVTLRGGGEEFIDLAYGWCVNLGAPAALVAGAVIATIYENIRGGDLEVKRGDTTYVKYAKKLTTFLLMTAFGLQIVSIFVTTVTGTMLLSGDAATLKTTSTTALGFLREHFEFEYLTSRITFLQGLLNWLGAVALEHTIPRKGEGKAAEKMNRFVASSLLTLILLLVSFYNHHMTFYHNYSHMLSRWLKVSFVRYVGQWPPRPLALLFVPTTLLSLYLGGRALQNEPFGDFSKEE
jgi:hypothetical protein